MSEFDWDHCTDPTPMLTFIRDSASDRKLRLFAAACCRRAWPLLAEERSRRAVEVAERYVDEKADDEDLRLAVIGAENVADAFSTASSEAQASAAFAALNVTVTAMKAADYAAANIGSATYHAATTAGAPSAARNRDDERAAQCRLLRDIFPFRPLTIARSIRTWNGGTVVRLATVIYEERCLPTGTLDNVRLAVLADALEEAGCHDETILRHCRQPEQVHVRGCWLIDLILQKA